MRLRITPKLRLLALPHDAPSFRTVSASERDPRDPAPEFVWNSWLRQPLLELGLYDHCPALLQVGVLAGRTKEGCCRAVCAGLFGVVLQRCINVWPWTWH